MERSIKVEIEGEDTFIVYVDDEKEQFCDTWAEACLWAGRYLHQCGMDELQDRINSLDDMTTGEILGLEKR